MVKGLSRSYCEPFFLDGRHRLLDYWARSVASTISCPNTLRSVRRRIVVVLDLRRVGPTAKGTETASAGCRGATGPCAARRQPDQSRPCRVRCRPRLPTSPCSPTSSGNAVYNLVICRYRATELPA